MPKFYPLVLLKKLDAIIERFEGWALVAILTVMVCVSFTQVVLRNFFSTALSWGDGLTRALVLWAGFIGASIAVKQGRYINIDALTRLFGERSKRLIRGTIYVFSMIICSLLGRASIGFVKMEHEAGTIYSIGVESWIVELVIPIVFFFLSFRFFLKTLSLLAGEELEKQEWER
jgi:C4-dicarboxylate transporter, DctQ subunit